MILDDEADDCNDVNIVKISLMAPQRSLKIKIYEMFCLRPDSGREGLKHQKIEIGKFPLFSV